MTNDKEAIPQHVPQYVIEEALRYAIEEAFAGDFTSLKERFPLKGTKLFEPTSLEELIDIRKALFLQFQDEVVKRLT